VIESLENLKEELTGYFDSLKEARKDDGTAMTGKLERMACSGYNEIGMKAA
jgi:hypothetical protein